MLKYLSLSICLITTSCSTETVVNEQEIRNSVYSNWSCTKTSLGIQYPSEPSCVTEYGCFKSKTWFNYCRQEVVDYTDALTRWNSCIREELIENAENINQALGERIECISNTPNCEKTWTDLRIKPPYIYNECSSLAISPKNELDCKYKLQDVPLCLKHYDKEYNSLSDCKSQIKSFQDQLKNWLQKSVIQKQESTKDQIDYVVSEFNRRANTPCK